MIAGITSRPMTKPLFITAARNSRTGHEPDSSSCDCPLGSRRLQPGAQRASRVAARGAFRHDPDEHVFETKPRQLDTRRRRAAASRAIAPAGSVPSASSTVYRRRPSRSTRSTPATARSARRISARIERLEPNRPRIELPPQSRHWFVQHLAALVNHHHVLAHLFGMAITWVESSMVAPRRCSLDDVFAQQPDADRIQTAERLVEDEQVGLVHDRGDELHALQHALRQFLAALVLGSRQIHALEQRGTRAAASSLLRPFSCAMYVRNAPTRIFR